MRHKTLSVFNRVARGLIAALAFSGLGLQPAPTLAEAQPARPAREPFQSAPSAKLASAPAAPNVDQANLQINIAAASANVVVPGADIQYNVSVTNNGPAAATNVQVVLSINNASFYALIVGGSAPGGWSCSTSVSQLTRICSRAAPMPNGANENFTFLLAPSYLSTYSGAYVEALVSATSEDPDTSNNTANPGDVTVTTSLTSADAVAEFGGWVGSPSSVPPGSRVTLIHGVRNAGPAVSSYTGTLNVNTAAGWRIMGNYQYEYSCTTDAATVVCQHSANLPAAAGPGSYAPIYTMLLAPTTPGTTSQQIVAQSGLIDPLPGNNTQNPAMSVDVMPNNNADLELVSAEVGPSNIEPGATAFYSISVRNNGPATAHNVDVFVPMFLGSNPEFPFFPATAVGALAPTGWSCNHYLWLSGLVCRAGKFAAGDAATFYLRFPATPTPGKHFDKPAIGSDTADSNTANNIGSATLEVNPSTAPTARVRVAVTHTGDQVPLQSGDTTVLKFKTYNDGPDHATNAYVGVFWDYYGGPWQLVSYNPPAGWTCSPIPGYDGGMDCYAPLFKAGSVDEWEVKLQAPSATDLNDARMCVLADSPVRNDYAAVYNSAAHKWACDSYYVTPFKANIRVTGVDRPDPVNAGGSLSYTVVVHNDGPDNLHPGYYRTFILKLDPGVSYQRLEGPTGWSAVTTFGSDLQFYFPRINAGEATTATIVVLAPSITGTIFATATATASDWDADMSNNTFLFDTRVSLGADAADLAVTLDAPTNVCLNASATLTATVMNNGPDPAVNPSVVITAPTGLQITGGSAPAGWSCATAGDSQSRTCTSTGLPNGGSATLSVLVTSNSAGNGQIKASASSSTADGNQGDNVAQRSVSVNVCGSGGRIAYIFNGEAADALAYESLLEGRGYTVDLIGLNAITSTNLNVYDLFVLADDSGRYPGDGEWFTWGTSQAETAAQMAPIIARNKPVIGLGEGGSVYLEKRGLSIGWLHAWYRTGDDDTARPTPLTAGAVYAFPNAIPADPVKVYNSNSASLNVFGPRMSSAAFPIGTEIPDDQHFNIVGEACHFGWGFRDDPTQMTSDGMNLFHNLVEYALHFQCPPPQPPPPINCVAISKSSNPANGARVPVSDGSARRVSLITYTLSYSVSNSPSCNNVDARLVDVVPQGTDFLPDSATDGVEPDEAGALTWTLAPGSSGTKQFTVVVLDSACALGLSGEPHIRNRARLLMPGRDPLESNEVKHEPVCAPVTGDNESAPFAQDELQVYPYPIIAGRVHTVSVRLINNTMTATVVTVRLMNSANAFGIGIPFNAFVTRTVSIPAFGNSIVQAPATFAATGHYCLCVEIDIPGYGTIRSCRNLDVMEDLRPGVPDTLTFAVGNPTNITTDIRLDVDNTCAGWTSVVAPVVLAGMAPGEVRTARLTTTPPNPVTFGSGCHIDVKGYYKLGSRWMPLNEGIRKLDVPPVQVSNPPGTVPWSSPLITFREEPLRAGVPNSICIEIHNPLPVTKVVTLTYQVANFGAGIGFTTVATRVVELPPNSIQKYCVSWTPPTAAHYCVLVWVAYPNSRPMQVQRNVDVLPNWRPDLVIPFVIRNPDLITHTLRFNPRMWGINPNLYEPIIRRPGGGDPPPDAIGAGQIVQLELRFGLRTQNQRGPQAPSAVAQSGANDNATFGDVQRVDVGVTMDGKDMSGFSVVFAQQGNKVFLPLVRK